MDRTQLRNAYEAIEEAYGLLPVPDDREFDEVLDALDGEYGANDYYGAYNTLRVIYELLAQVHDFAQKYG